jgi:hypothetical protein
VLACEPLRATRVVADPVVLDSIEWPPASLPLRIAPDDVLVIGTAAHQVVVEDVSAIVVDEAGFVGVWLSADQWAEVAAEHVEWHVPGPGTLSQGWVASVPAKVWMDADGRALVICAAAYRAELEERVA